MYFPVLSPEPFLAYFYIFPYNEAAVAHNNRRVHETGVKPTGHDNPHEWLQSDSCKHPDQFHLSGDEKSACLIQKAD
jgi:hypothetical protein